MLLDSRRPVPPRFPTQPLVRALRQQLLTQRLGVLAELVRVLLLVALHPAVHLLPLHFLLPRPEGRLALYHLVEQAPEAEPVWAEGVPLVVYNFRCWK